MHMCICVNVYMCGYISIHMPIASNCQQKKSSWLLDNHFLKTVLNVSRNLKACTFHLQTLYACGKSFLKAKPNKILFMCLKMRKQKALRICI